MQFFCIHFRVIHSGWLFYLQRTHSKVAPSWFFAHCTQMLSASLETWRHEQHSRQNLGSNHLSRPTTTPMQFKQFIATRTHWFKHKLPQLGICKFARGIFLLLSFRQYKSWVSGLDLASWRVLIHTMSQEHVNGLPTRILHRTKVKTDQTQL